MPGEDSPRFECWVCGGEIIIPKSQINFPCPHCTEPHKLADYLGIGHDSPDEWSREDTATALRDSMETLTLFHLIRSYLDKPAALERILFVKDGPLLLRAALSRLVEPIRALIEHMKSRNLTLNLVGVEKNGDLVAHVDEFQNQTAKSWRLFCSFGALLDRAGCGEAISSKLSQSRRLWRQSRSANWPTASGRSECSNRQLSPGAQSKRFVRIPNHFAVLESACQSQISKCAGAARLRK
jgi:hypothetical protein